MKVYRLVSGNGEIYDSLAPGLLGGNRRKKIYGKLDCPSANRYINKGYSKVRVFFATIDDAISAGYRPCAKCMRKEYLEWKKAISNEKDIKYNTIFEENALGRLLTKAEYKKAIGRGSLSANQIKLLNGWYKEGKNNWANPELLKRVMGYEEASRVNIDVGSIGKLIIENQKLDPDNYLTEDRKQTAYWSVYCDLYDLEKGWHLSSEFFNSIIELHILNV